jgi:shikimate kinase
VIEPERARIALIGFRGTGKTTVGRIVADRLGLEFLDADAALEHRLGLSVAEVFRDRGEPAFRDEEQATLAAIAHEPHPTGVVVATGGGAVLRAANREVLNSRFPSIVWLDASPEAILARLAHTPRGKRPALTDRPIDEEVRMLLADREPWYRALAHVRIATDGLRPDQVADAVLEALRIGARP